MVLSRGSRWFLAFGLLVLAGLAAAVWWLDAEVFDRGVEPGQPVEYTVERGSSLQAVGEDLAELDVVRSAVRFRLAADDEVAAALQPGLFEFETGMSVDEALAVLAAGPVAPPTVRFTVAEGLTVDETLERLAAAFEAYEVADFAEVLEARTEAGENEPGRLQIPGWVPEPAEAGEDISPYEGLLWPQTYEVDDEAEPRAVLQRMVDQLEREVDALDLPDEDRYRILTIASLVERETRVAAERGTVAGVIANRLEEGMRLQIDATVVFAHGGGPTQQVLLEDLEIDSPYNTYVVDGLPPTPISGVGTASLAAAADPADVPYRFYVLDPACDGSHRFAETNEEHDENVAAFREAGRCLEEEP